MKRRNRRLTGSLALATAAFVSMPAAALAFPAGNGIRLAPGLANNRALSRVILAPHVREIPGLRLLEPYVVGQKTDQ
jgi:hypothetical protein